MYIAKKYFETKFNKTFKKGDKVPDEIAKVYFRNVEELLIDDSSSVEADVKVETAKEELIIEDVKEEDVSFVDGKLVIEDADKADVTAKSSKKKKDSFLGKIKKGFKK